DVVAAGRARLRVALDLGIEIPDAPVGRVSAGAGDVEAVGFRAVVDDAELIDHRQEGRIVAADLTGAVGVDDVDAGVGGVAVVSELQVGLEAGVGRRWGELEPVEVAGEAVLAVGVDGHAHDVRTGGKLDAGLADSAEGLPSAGVGDGDGAG